MNRQQTKDRPSQTRLGERELTIERIVGGGVGLGYADGMTMFVPLTAPGDRVRIQLERSNEKVAHGRLLEVLDPSPLRVDPPHPALSTCGGCDFQHLAYEAQVAIKGEIIRDSLRRIGDMDLGDITVTPSPLQWGYRMRAEWRVDTASGAFGYVGRGTHRVCDLEEDPLVEAPLAEELWALRIEAARGALPSGSVHAATDGRSVSRSYPGGEEPRELEIDIAGDRLRFDAACFFQANRAILPALVEEAVGRLAANTDGRVFDLFCGVGLFTLPLARTFWRVTGVESDTRTASFARRNAEQAGLGNVQVIQSPVEAWLSQRASGGGLPHLVLVDPPREGLEPKVIKAIGRLAPAAVVYVSCDPATLARDLKRFVVAGYAVDRVVGFDMFPQTHHVEVVAHLSRMD